MVSGVNVTNIMATKIAIAHPEMTIDTAAKIMNKFRIGGLPVIENGIIAGMITERDIMKRVIAANRRPGSVKVREVMTIHPVIADEDKDVDEIAELMAKTDVTRIPIIDKENKVTGIITNRDILNNRYERVDLLLEQAKIKGVFAPEHAAFGSCEMCGKPSALIFKDNRYVCDECIAGKKGKQFFKWFKAK